MRKPDQVHFIITEEFLSPEGEERRRRLRELLREYGVRPEDAGDEKGV